MPNTMRLIFARAITAAIIVSWAQTTPAENSRAEDPPPSLEKINVSNGEKDFIQVTWEAVEGAELYRVYRSLYRNRLFIEIGKTDKCGFTDIEALPGFRYWYRITAGPEAPSEEGAIPALPGVYLDQTAYIRKRDIPLRPLFTLDELESFYRDGKKAYQQIEPSVIEGYNYSGYRMPLIPSGERLEKMMEQADRAPEIKPDPGQEKTLAFLEKYYLHSARLNLALLIARPFLAVEAITLFSGFETISLNRGNRRIIFIGKDWRFMAAITSVRLFLIMDNAPDLLQARTLIDNAEIYCVFMGLQSRIDPSGAVRIMPFYEAAGLTTRLNKYDRNWRKKTIAAPSGNKELMGRLIRIAGLKSLL